MKIGILTFHKSENYGSVLQAYALCKKLISLDSNNQVEIVDYSNEKQRALYAGFHKMNSAKNIAKNARSLLNISQLTKRSNAFYDFFNLLPLSEEEFNSDEELKNHKSSYDLLILGSDQIWNPQSVDFSMAYFGVDFKCKKVAYAPSIRDAKASDFEPYKDEIKAALSKIKKLSLREKNTVPVLKQFTRKKIECVCDPTLLLSAEEFDLICSKSKIKKDYIFYYSIDYNPQSVEMVKYISKALNLPVYFIFSSNKAYDVYFKGFRLSKSNAPGDFISLVKNAALVLSTSFHGVAFSVIYRKPFFALKTRGYTDSRINELLTELQLENRYLDYQSYQNTDFSAPPEYSDELIEKMKDRSVNYLKECLND